MECSGLCAWSCLQIGTVRTGPTVFSISTLIAFEIYALQTGVISVFLQKFEALSVWHKSIEGQRQLDLIDPESVYRCQKAVTFAVTLDYMVAVIYL